MSLWHIAWSYLWNRKFTTLMTVLSVALGVGLISAVLTLREETRKRFEEEGQAFDVVVGQKGNPLQLVLNAVYFLSDPTGNISYENLERLKKEEDVIGAFPVCLGDSLGEYRIVGTTLDLMNFSWGEQGRSPYALNEGRYWEKPFEAVIGAQVAEMKGLTLGSKFVGAHGFVEHGENPYVVTGILQRSGTPNDRAIFCDMTSIWDAHKHGDEGGEGEHHEEEGAHEVAGAEHVPSNTQITAVLIKLYTPALRPEFVRRINQTYSVMPAIPVLEIQKLYNQLLNIAKMVLLAIGYLVVVISSISILIGLYLSIIQRKKDLAIMRALGASRGEIFGAVIIEAFWVTLLGIAAGWLMGSLTCVVLGWYLAQALGFYIPPMPLSPDLITAYSAVMLMGLLAGILPAWQAYRSDVAKDLAEL